MHNTLFAAYVVWAGIVWRMRGGAFTTLTGIDPGTQGARALAALALSLPLVTIASPVWLAFLVAPGILFGLMLSGWEEFQGMGTETGYLLTEKPGYWPRRLPSMLGLQVGTFPYDVMGMMQVGVLCMLPSILLLANWCRERVLFLVVAGLLFGPAYLMARFLHPDAGKFAKGQEWGETFTGMIVGAALFYVLSPT